MTTILQLELDTGLLLAATSKKWGFPLPLAYLEEVTKTINVIKTGLPTTKYWGFSASPESISEYFIPLSILINVIKTGLQATKYWRFFCSPTKYLMVFYSSLHTKYSLVTSAEEAPSCS